MDPIWGTDPYAVLLSLFLGLGLAAACGFRVFVPLLVLSVAARAGWVDLDGGFGWLAGSPALIAFAVATVLEVGAYYVPWLDNLLDGVASPAAVVAGVVVTASVVTGIDPFLKWTLAVIAGGGLAGSVQLLTTGTRGASTLGTGGIGNPLVSTAEVGGSLVLALLSVVVPTLGALLALSLVWLIWRRRLRRRRPVAAG